MSMAERLNAAMYGAKRSAIREFSRLAAATPDCVRLTLGEPDFDTPAPVCARVEAALAAGETHYIENNGLFALREKIAAFEREKNGMDYAASDVIVTAGATEALFVALFGILDPGDEVIVPTPAFVLYERIIGLCRGVFVPLDTSKSGFQIDPEALERLVTPRTKAIVLNTPNNPTGCVYDRASLEAVRRAVEAREIFVICDDVYRQLCYAPDYHSFAEYQALRDRILVSQSFSKPYAMTGWRMGYLLCDAPVRERLELAHRRVAQQVAHAPAGHGRAGLGSLRHGGGIPAAAGLRGLRAAGHGAGDARAPGRVLRVPVHRALRHGFHRVLHAPVEGGARGGDAGRGLRRGRAHPRVLLLRYGRAARGHGSAGRIREGTGGAGRCALIFSPRPGRSRAG